MTNDIQRFVRVFSRLEDFARKIYLFNEDIASMKQRLIQMREAIEKDIKGIKEEIEIIKNESHYRNKF